MEHVAESLDHAAVEALFSGVIRLDRDDEVEFSAAYGLAHRGLQWPNTVNTQFAVASGGKGFTALMVISLIVDGVLSLESPARTFLGNDLPLVPGDVTVMHLLTHRSGIGDYLGGEGSAPTDYVLSSPVHELDSTEGFLIELDGHPAEFTAGERFAYCDAGYVLLALIAERATGIPYHDLVEERVFRPAEMLDTAFLRADEPSGRMALGYLYPGGLRTNAFHLPIRGNGDGGVYTTAADMHAFWTALFRGSIVPGDWVEQIIRESSVVADEDARFGLGMWLSSTGSTVKLVGSDAGVSFYSAHDPIDERTGTVISNTTDGAWSLVQRIRTLVRD